MTLERTPIWPAVRGLIGDGVLLLRRGGARLLAVIIAFQLVILVVVFPLLRWRFREALRAGGMTALDLGAFTSSRGLPVTFGLIVLLCTLTFWLVALQFTILVVLISHSGNTRAPSLRHIATQLGGVCRKLIRPSSVLLLLYLFVVLPLTGFGFTSAMVQGISIPAFITGELYKTTSTAIMLIAFLVVLGVINTRMALTVPLFALTEATGAMAARGSWRLTRGRGEVEIVLSVAFVLCCTTILSSILAGVSLGPTALSDLLAPSTSPVVAAYSLGAGQVMAMLLSGLVTSMVAAMLIVYLYRRQHQLPAGIVMAPIDLLDDRASVLLARRGRRRILGSAAAWVTAAAAALTLIFGSASIGTLQGLSEQPEALVLAHRGFTTSGVENTIESLEAAAEVGADLVEMDVMESKDGQFMVMHDANLKRLTGENLNVKDLTGAELSTLTVHDLSGHEGKIPSLAQYIQRAQELAMPLLIELKLHGSEAEDHVARLVAELEDLDALDENIYHSLDKASVEQLKWLRPDLSVGYTMAFAGVDAPDTVADFIVVEDWTASPAMQAAAERAGLGYMVWTVNDAKKQRTLLRENVDGMITDHPETALTARAGMGQDTGFAHVLGDMLSRFIVVI